MTFAAPVYLAFAALAAGVVALLHLLVRRRPPSRVLPTTRFIPDVPAAATAVARRPADVPLLLLRMLALLLVGAALAGPRFAPSRRGIARVVVLDLSRAADRGAMREAARAHTADAAAIVAFDATAREIPADSLEPLLAAAGSGARGSLSAALLVALRAGARLREEADSLALVLVTPAVAEEADAATRAIRALWPGRADLVRVPARRPTPAGDTVTMTWADSGAAGWMRRERADRPGAVRAGDAVLVAPLVRAWRVAPGDSSRVVARWIDGEPAAVERAASGGCARSVGFAMPSEGDVALRPDAVRLLAALRSAPCDDAYDAAPMSDALVAALRGPARLARAADFRAAPRGASALAPWLLALALLLLVAEYPLRRARKMQAAAAAAHRVERAA